jgi:DNA-binding NarL/FixJ family response regulator
MNRILLVEDHNVVRDALASALNREPDLEVGAQTRSLAEARITVALA